jgi:hypothetical protein
MENQLKIVTDETIFFHISKNGCKPFLRVVKHNLAILYYDYLSNAPVNYLLNYNLKFNYKKTTPVQVKPYSKFYKVLELRNDFLLKKYNYK